MKQSGIGLCMLALALAACTRGPAGAGQAPPEAPREAQVAPPAPTWSGPADLRTMTPVRLALRDYAGVELDLEAHPDPALTEAVKALGEAVDYPSPPIHPTPFYQLTLAGPDGVKVDLSYVGNGHWETVTPEMRGLWVEGQGLAEAVRAALPVPARQSGEVEYLFLASDLQVTGVQQMGWNDRRQVVVRVLRDSIEPGGKGQVPETPPVRFTFEVNGRPEVVEVWDHTVRYGDQVWAAPDVLSQLGIAVSAG